MLKKPQNIYIPIDKLQAKVFKRETFEERGKWITKMVLALSEEDEEEFAAMLLNDSRYKMYKEVVRQWKYKAKQSLVKDGIKEPTEKQIYDKCVEDYGIEYVEAEELIAKNDKRNKVSGDASDSDAEDGTAAGENPGTAARANVSKTKKARANEKQPLHSERDAGAESRIIFKAPTKEELYDYCAEHGIDQADARDCWEMCESRQWADRDGAQINDWKGFV